MSVPWKDLKSPMRKVRFEAIGASVLFILVGMTCTIWFGSNDSDQILAPPRVIVLVLFFGFLIVFETIRGIWNKKLGLPLRYSLIKYDIRLEDNKREVTIARMAYKHAFDTVLWA